MLYYNNEITDINGYIYSLDRVRIGFTLYKHEVEYISALFSQDDIAVNISKPCLSDFKYRHLININGERGTTLTVGICFNGYDADDKLKGFLDYNPNKMDVNQNRYIARLQACCREFKFVRCDVACDIPLSRQCFRILREGNRPYQTYEASLEDFTEYLGTRSHIGFVKVYNKRIESKLDYDLTRIEITVEPYVSSYRDNLPYIQIKSYRQLEIEENKFNDTELVILDLLNEVTEDKKNYYFRRLGRKIKEKIKPYLDKQVERFEPNYKCIESVLQYIRDLEK